MLTASKSSLLKAQENLATVNQRTRHTISTASFAFGGHISKGLLSRARSAQNQHNTANVKCGRARLFERLSRLPPLTGFHMTDENWQELSEIVYKMTLWSDPADRYDYRSASVGFECFPMLEAARNFVKKYAGSRIQKELHLILYKETAPC